MSNPTASRGPSISDHLRAAKEILQDVIFEARSASALEKAEVDALERDAFEVLRLIRSWRNIVAPINKIPPEILALIPDFLDPSDKAQDVVVLTHTCRAWREVFISRSSLWVDFDCKDGDKTRVYLERSKSAPINLSLARILDAPCDPFFQVIPYAIGRLKILYIAGESNGIQVIVDHLSHPAPLLEYLTIDCNGGGSDDYPVLTSSLFGGDLSSLRMLHLDSIRTDLPWRNMANLTSLTLACLPPDVVSVGRFLDFLEGAPHLREVNLQYAIPTAGAQDERLVSLVCLKSMYIDDSDPSSVLLDHLVIPVGTRLTTRGELHRSLIGEHLPRSLDNLKNLSGFTAMQLYANERHPRVKFSGPNGEVNANTTTTTGIGASWIELVLESLAQLDTSKTERLEINGGNPQSRYSIYRALLPMTDLHTFVLSRCMNPDIFIRVLHPDTNLSRVAVCPTLEELVVILPFSGEKFNIRNVVEMAAARASRGKRLRNIRIVDGRDKPDSEDLLELKKHVQNVDYSPRVFRL